MMMKAEIGVLYLQAKERQRLLARHWKLGVKKEEFSYGFQSVHDLANTFIVDLQPPEL